MSEEETKTICKKVIDQVQAKSIKDMGKVMGVFKKGLWRCFRFFKSKQPD